MLTKEKTILTYTDELGSSLPAPGGGGASAISAALGTSLLMMVTNLTIGKKKYLEYEPRLKELLSFLTEKKAEFLSLADKDEEAFMPLFNAYRLPNETDEQKSFRAQEIERLLYSAAGVPMLVLEAVDSTVPVACELCTIGSRLAVSDVAVGISQLSSACDAAYLNVIINTGMIKDREAAEKLNQRALLLKNRINETSTLVYTRVCNEISH